MKQHTIFETGDVVRLNSGGPNMSVGTIEGDWITCQWFAGDELQQANFRMEMVYFVTERV